MTGIIRNNLDRLDSSKPSNKNIPVKVCAAPQETIGDGAKKPEVSSQGNKEEKTANPQKGMRGDEGRYLLNKADILKLKNWNSTVLTRVRWCMHKLIIEYCYI